MSDQHKARDTESRDTRALPYSALHWDDLPVADRISLWRESMAPLFDARPLEPGRPYSASIKLYLVDTVAFGQATFNSQKFIRDHSWRRRHDQDNFLLQLYTSGGYTGHNGRNSLTVRSGDICFLDLGRDLSTQAGDSSTISLTIPRSVVREVFGLSDLKGGIVLPRESELTQVISRQMSALWEQMGSLSLAQARLMIEALLTMTRSAARALQQGNQDIVACPQIEAAQLDLLCDYIDRNLGDPSLSADSLCRHFHLSRASLYRQFSPLGGVTKYINVQRLERCYHHIRTRATDGSSIALIAQRYGFSSYPHFSRSFKKYFGLSPREVAGMDTGIFDFSEIHNAGTSRVSSPDFRDWFLLR